MHSLSSISPKSKVHSSAKIGPFVTISDNVEIGEDVEIGPYTFIGGGPLVFVKIGKGTKVDSHVVLGGRPLDLTYSEDQVSKLYIGKNNLIQERCIIHPGFKSKEGVTSIGDNNVFGPTVHLGHDARVGDNVVALYGSAIGGHASIGNFATLGSFSKILPFVRVGEYSFVKTNSLVFKSILPFLRYPYVENKKYTNTKGLLDRGFTVESIKKIESFYKAVLEKEPRGILAVSQEIKTGNPEYVSLLELLHPEHREVFIQSLDSTFKW